jgi:hypothetical protein
MTVYSKFNWETTDVQELYTGFKELEKVFDQLIEKDARAALNAVSDFNQIRDYLIKCGTLIIQKDVAYAKSKELDKRIWVLMRKQLECMSRTKVKTETTEQETLQLININMELLKGIMEAIPKKS